MLIPRIAFLPKMLFSQDMHIQQIRFFRDMHIGPIHFLGLSRWDTNSARERRGAERVPSRREAAWRQGLRQRSAGGRGRGRGRSNSMSGAAFQFNERVAQTPIFIGSKP